MSNVKEVKSNQNPAVVEMLENLLEQAKLGEIQSLAIAGLSPSAESFNCFVGDYYPIALIGELRILERDVVDLCVDTRRKPAWEFCE